MNTWFRRTPETDALVAEERLVLAATEMVHDALAATGTTRKELATRLGVRPTEISQRLSGRRNLTLRSLAQMMHALGYGIKIDATEPVDLEAATKRIGARVVKQVDAEPVEQVGNWEVEFRVRVNPGGEERRELVTRRVDSVIEELRTLDRIRAVGVSYSERGAVVVRLSVEADDALSASQIGITALRSAIHSVGDGTPGWEGQMERMVQDLRIELEASRRSGETTPCG